MIMAAAAMFPMVMMMTLAGLQTISPDYYEAAAIDGASHFTYFLRVVLPLSGMIIAVPLGIFVMNLYQYGAFDGMIESAKELGEEIRKLRK